MKEKLLSATINIPISEAVDSDKIELYLSRKYNNIFRWAIVGVCENDVKITFSYRQDAL